jgi:hypothetical protein
MSRWSSFLRSPRPSARSSARLSVLAAAAMPLVGCATLTILNPFVSDDPWMSDDAIDKLEDDEDATEALERDLTDWSQHLMHGAWVKAAGLHTRSSTVASFPRRAAEPAASTELVLTYAWSGEGGGPLSRVEVAERWRQLFAQFAEVEAARARVVSARFDDDDREAADARIRLKLVTKDAAGRREWVIWEADARMVLDDDTWRIERLAFDHPTSRVAARPLFTEVSAPAGVALDLGAVKPDLNGSGAYQFFGGAVADLNGDGFLDLYMTSFDRNFLYLNQGGTFVDVAEQAGVAHVENPEPVGPLFVDYDNDGDQDLFVAIASRTPPWTPQRLFRNDSVVKDGKVELRFTDVSRASGADVTLSGYSAVAGDIDNDGDVDIYITSYLRWDMDAMPNRVYGADGPENKLLVNQGDGTFKEEAAARGVACPYFSFSGEFVDYDEDGDLDLMVSNDFNSDRLYQNDGTGHFTDITVAAGVDKPGMGMGVHFSDVDNDGDLDLHAVYMSNVGGQRVIDSIDWSAVGGGEKKREMMNELIIGNRLYENTLRSPGDDLSVRNVNGDGVVTFVDITRKAGPFPAEWAWGGGFIDVDNDSREDLYCTNGFYSGESMHDTAAVFWRKGAPVATDDGVGTDITFGKTMVMAATPLLMNGRSWSGYERDKLYLQVDDVKFEDISGLSGLDDPGDGRITIHADFDNDGDMDIFLSNGQRETHRLFRNEIGQDKGFVRLVLVGKTSPDGFGAQVRVKTSRGVMTHAKAGGESFISQYDPRPLFGLNGEPEAEWVEVRWLSGESVRAEHVPAGTTLRFVEGEPAPTVLELPIGRLGEGAASVAASADRSTARTTR